MIFDPQSPGGTIDRASSITPGTSSDEASTLDGAGTTCLLALISVLKVKVKVGFFHSATHMVEPEQRALTISEVAVDWQEPVVLQRKCGHPLPALTDIGPRSSQSV